MQPNATVSADTCNRSAQAPRKQELENVRSSLETTGTSASDELTREGGYRSSKGCCWQSSRMRDRSRRNLSQDHAIGLATCIEQRHTSARPKALHRTRKPSVCVHRLHIATTRTAKNLPASDKPGCPRLLCLALCCCSFLGRYSTRYTTHPCLAIRGTPGLISRAWPC